MSVVLAPTATALDAAVSDAATGSGTATTAVVAVTLPPVLVAVRVYVVVPSAPGVTATDVPVTAPTDWLIDRLVASSTVQFRLVAVLSETVDFAEVKESITGFGVTTA